MRALFGTAAAVLSLLLAPAPATSLDILSGLEGSGLDRWADLEPVILEFGDDDWALLVDTHTADHLLPDLGVPDQVPDPAEEQISQVWEPL